MRIKQAGVECVGISGTAGIFEERMKARPFDAKEALLRGADSEHKDPGWLWAKGPLLQEATSDGSLRLTTSAALCLPFSGPASLSVSRPMGS